MSSDPDFEIAKRLFRRACWEFMDSNRRGQQNDLWFDLANKIELLWPEVNPERKLFQKPDGK